MKTVRLPMTKVTKWIASKYNTCPHCKMFLELHPTLEVRGVLRTHRHQLGRHLTLSGRRLHALMLKELLQCGHFRSEECDCAQLMPEAFVGGKS